MTKKNSISKICESKNLIFLTQLLDGAASVALTRIYQVLSVNHVLEGNHLWFIHR